MLAYGEGVPKDEVQSFAWTQKAADQGEALDQLNLGIKYQFGRGVPKDLEQAFAWYHKAALQGNALAQNSIGTFFENGIGGQLQDYEAALTWYRKAASQGEKFAQRNLAKMYLYGRGVTRSLVIAYAWMNLAAARGHTNASTERDYIAARLSSQDLLSAQQLSKGWRVGHLIPD